MTRKMMLTALLALLVAVTATTASAAVIRVPRDHATAQEAVDAAVSGDEIVIKGVRTGEALTLSHKTDLTIRGRKGASVMDIDLLWCRNIRIEGLVVEGSQGGAAVYLWDSHVVVLRKLVIRDAAGFGILASYVSHLTIEKSKLKRLGESGISLGHDTEGSSWQCIVRKNRISSVALHGIHVFRVVDSRIEKNRVVNAGTSGIAIGEVARRNTLLSNRVEASPNGYAVLGNNNTLERNRVKHAQYNGFTVFGGTGNALIRNRSKNAMCGFQVEASNNSFIENRASGSTICDLQEVGDGNTFADNRFETILRD